MLFFSMMNNVYFKDFELHLETNNFPVVKLVDFYNIITEDCYVGDGKEKHIKQLKC